MILVTVGMQLGFDRLIAAMDRLAPTLGMPVIAQTGRSTFVPQNMDTRPVIAPDKFEALISDCRLIVSHAGIGTVLTAARWDKPVVLLPRRADLGEHRNDHQMATAHHLSGRSGILIAMEESELGERIAEGLALTNWTPASSPSVMRMHKALTDFLEAARA